MQKKSLIKCFIVIAVLLGVVFTVFSIGWVPMLSSLMDSGAKNSAALTQKNEIDWKDVPGDTVRHDNYLFSCINKDEVIYGGETPVFEQYGPFIYKETEDWTNVKYDQELEVTGTQDESFKENLSGLKASKGLTADYEWSAQLWTQGKDLMDFKNLDTQLNITNQAAMGVWWAQLNQPKWKIMLNLIHITIQDLGRQLTDRGVYQLLGKAELLNASNLQTFFFVDVAVTSIQAEALFFDPIYGLKYQENFARWGAAFNPGHDQTKSLIFQMELRSYFGLTIDHVNEFKKNWEMIFNMHENEFLGTLPAGSDQDLQAVGYWQWASSFVTMHMNMDDPQPSVTKVLNTITGYPEIFYWQQDYLCDKAKSNITDGNKAELCSVKFDDNLDYNFDNLNYLFDMDTNPFDKEGYGIWDPAQSSLYNITTLKSLLDVGERTTNILQSPEARFEQVVGEMFDDWKDLSVLFRFCNVTNCTIEDVKKPYLIYLWLETLSEQTFQRQQDGGNVELGVIPSLGSSAFTKYMQYMSLEMPLMTYQHVLLNATAHLPRCEIFYSEFGFSLMTMHRMCSDRIPGENNFWDTKSLDTMYALLNIYFYGNDFNPNIAKEFKYLIQGDDSALYHVFRNENSKFAKFVQENVINKTTEFYQTSFFCKMKETQLSKQCSFQQIALGQWSSSAITGKPMYNMQQYIWDLPYQERVWNYPYRKIYPNMTINGAYVPQDHVDFNPEMYYFTYKANMTEMFPSDEEGQSTFNFTEIMVKMSDNYLFNQQLWGDILLQADSKSNYTIFDTDQFRRYLKHVTFQAGLHGMFIEQTPRKIIEGYNDTLIEELIATYIHKGGDQKTSKFLSLNKSPTNPSDNTIAFFSGQVDSNSDEKSFLLTRLYQKWLNREHVTMKRKDYVNINELADVYENPWAEEVFINGTDGNQFHPGVQEDEILTKFVQDFARTLNFEYKDSDTTTFEDIELMNFHWSEMDMKNWRVNPENKKYFTEHDGTINMTSVMNAYAIGTKGHFYQIAKDLKNDLSIIQDHDGKVIGTDPDEDDTNLSVERNSGVTVKSRHRIQINFQMHKNHSLFNHLKEDYVMPFVFVKRDSIMTKDQVHDILGSLITSQKIMIPMQVVGIVLTVLMVICSALLCRKHKQIANDPDYESLLRESKLSKSGISDYKKINRSTMQSISTQTLDNSENTPQKQ